MQTQQTPPLSMQELTTDFSKLAQKYPPLHSFLKSRNKDNGGYRCSLDFRDPLALQTLSAAILSSDFGVNDWALPADRLCPPIPSRFEYLCWISQLLELPIGSSTESSGTTPQSVPSTATKVITGLDIGTGCSCVYPLLGASAFGWHFLASDVDATAYTWATRNVQKAGFTDKITVRLVQPIKSPLDAPRTDNSNEINDEASSSNTSTTDNRSFRNSDLSSNTHGGPLSTAVLESDGTLDFCMCNPPFFATAEEAVRAHPMRSCPGAAGELWCPGGEVAFVSSIVGDSVKLRTRVRWYTTLLGKKASLKVLLRKLRQLPVDQRPTDVRTTVLNAGATEGGGNNDVLGTVGSSRVVEEEEHGVNEESVADESVLEVNASSTSTSNDSTSSSSDAGVVTKSRSFDGARRWVLAWTFHPGAAPAPASAKVLARQPKERKTTLHNAGAIQGAGGAVVAITSEVEAAAAAALASRPELGALRVLCVLPSATSESGEGVTESEQNRSFTAKSAGVSLNTLGSTAASSPSSEGKRTSQALSGAAMHETAVVARGNKRARFEPTPLREAAFAGAGEAAPYDDRRDMVMPVNIFACDICGRTLRGGLAGFEVFASCEVCEEFDVCLECCDSTAASSGSKNSSRKKKKGTEKSVVQEAPNSQVPRVLKVANHFKGKHTFKLVDRNLDEDDVEEGGDDNNNDGKDASTKESDNRVADRESQSMEGITTETSRDADILSTSDGVAQSNVSADFTSSSAVVPSEAIANVTPAQSTSDSTNPNYGNDSGISAIEMLQRLAAAASAGEDTLPAFASSIGRHLCWEASLLSVPPKSTNSATKTMNTSAAMFTTEHQQEDAALQVSGATVNEKHQPAVIELEAALGLSLGEATAALNSGAMLVMGVRGEDTSGPDSGIAARGAPSSSQGKPSPSLWFEGTLAVLCCQPPAGDSSTSPLGGVVETREDAKWVVLGAVKPADQGGPWGSTGFGLLADALAGELGRTNRRWRRKLKQSSKVPGN